MIYRALEHAQSCRSMRCRCLVCSSQYSLVAVMPVTFKTCDHHYTGMPTPLSNVNDGSRQAQDALRL